jgi:hypothetical protein
MPQPNKARILRRTGSFSDNPFCSEAWRSAGPGRGKLFGVPRLAWTALALIPSTLLLAWTLPPAGPSGLRLTPFFPMGCLALAVLMPALTLSREMERLQNAKLYGQLYLSPATHLHFFRPAARQAALELSVILGTINATLWLMPFYREDVAGWLLFHRPTGRLFLLAGMLFPVLAWLNASVAALAAALFETPAGRQSIGCLWAVMLMLGAVSLLRMTRRYPDFAVLLVLGTAGLLLGALAWGIIALPSVGERFWRVGLAAEENALAED